MANMRVENLLMMDEKSGAATAVLSPNAGLKSLLSEVIYN